MPRPAVRTWAAIGLGLLASVLAWWLGTGAGPAAPRPDAPVATRPDAPVATTPSPRSAPGPDTRPRAPGAPGALDLDAIADGGERAAVAQVAAAIDAGADFRYRQDGAVWQNREHRLPTQPRGYYREYTVDTPGESDRGARRIIAGGAGELFYTRDHYRSFVAIRAPTRGP